MESTARAGNDLTHEFYSKTIQEEENMVAGGMAILNKIHENRVRLKELHAEFGAKFTETINSYRERHEDNLDHYHSLMRDMSARREQITEMCNRALNNT